MPDDPRLDLLALCALRDDNESVDWSLIAREARRPDGIPRLLAGAVLERTVAAQRARERLMRLLDQLPDARERVRREMDLASDVNARLITVLDDDYPPNLRLISNLPPFLFMRGRALTPDDNLSVAVVGTRKPSPEGRSAAAHLASALADHSVTVVSGLAAGIDAEAHRAALDAGGRTIAVIGTGITRTYPKENAELQAEIIERGTVVSQFWPSTSPARWTFPRRNVVMSGIAQGTAVIQASSTSGAKMQARLALEHGKRVFLHRELVTPQKWAQDYVARGAVEMSDVDDVLRWLAQPDRIREVTEQRQMTLDLV